jgi:hypothetical protein
MDKNSLRDLLGKLHAESSDARRVDPKSTESLDQLMLDIHGRIDESAAAESSPAESLSDRLEGVAVQFEADHPTLAASARRLIDLLAEVGI